MTRERFLEIIKRARALLELTHAPELTIHGLDLGLRGPVMTLKIESGSRELDCMVRGVWGDDEDERWQAVIDVLDWIMPGERAHSYCERISVYYRDDAGPVAKVHFYW